MKTKLATFILIIALLPAFATAETLQKRTAQELAAEIETASVGIVLSRYNDTPVWDNSIIPGIESASEEWLELAEQFLAVSDGWESEQLSLALSNAIAVDPFRVLPVLQRIYKSTVEQLCTSSFEAEIPKGGVTNYLDKIEAKLKKAKTKTETIMATECLRGIEITRKNAKAQGLE
jgi:hypothetical protein